MAVNRMDDDEKGDGARPIWSPGAVRNAVVAAAKKMAGSQIPIPGLPFYEALAARAEEISDEAIAEAIAARRGDTETVLVNIHIARRLLYDIGDDLFLASEQADDAVIARLAAHLVVEGNDGYNEISFVCAWGAHRDPEWGTIWSIHQGIRDFIPAFIFKVCMRGDTRFLAVECHAPTRRLPDDLHARLRARTMMISGVPVMAFSPVEVEADAAACVMEITGTLSVLAQELLALHQIDVPPSSRRDFRPRGEAN